MLRSRILFASLLLHLLLLSLFSIEIYAAASLKARPAIVKPQHLDVNITAVVETILKGLSLGVRGVGHVGDITSKNLISGANFTARQTAKYSTIAGKGLLSGAKTTANKVDESGKMVMKYSKKASKYTLNGLNKTIDEICTVSTILGEKSISCGQFVGRYAVLTSKELNKCVNASAIVLQNLAVLSYINLKKGGSNVLYHLANTSSHLYDSWKYISFDTLNCMNTAADILQKNCEILVKEGILVKDEIWKMICIGSDAMANFTQATVHVSCDLLQDVCEGAISGIASVGNLCRKGIFYVANKFDKGLQFGYFSNDLKYQSLKIVYLVVGDMLKEH